MPEKPREVPAGCEDMVHETITELCRDVTSVLPPGTVAAFALKIPGMEAFCATNIDLEATRAFLILVADTMTSGEPETFPTPPEMRKSTRLNN
jgi:hypothetical protein